MKMRSILCTILFLAVAAPFTSAQLRLAVQGNGLFSSASSTNVDIKNTDDNTNALLRFGDNNVSKASIGFNGNEDVFKISMAATLGREDFTLAENGRIGINALPTDHRFFISHNSTSGTTGSAHLTLEEAGLDDYNRLRFQNAGQNGLWTIAARATDGQSLMNVFYNDGTNFANLMSFDGDLFRVGIHQTAPQAYLHIKQQNAGVDALQFENDDATGGEIWGWRIGDNDILLYFQGDLRASFNSDDGVYTNFPPPAAFTGAQNKYQDRVLDDIMKLRTVRIKGLKDKNNRIGLNPEEVAAVNAEWVTPSEDGTRLGLNYQQLTTLAIKAIQELTDQVDEQQELIKEQTAEIKQLRAERAGFEERLARIEAQLAPPAATTPDLPPLHQDKNNWQGAVPQLQQNIPNPFGEKTTIDLSIPEAAGSARLQLSNVQGNMVRTFNLSKGRQHLTINAQDLESGTYYYSLIVDGELIDTRQLIIRK